MHGKKKKTNSTKIFLNLMDVIFHQKVPVHILGQRTNRTENSVRKTNNRQDITLAIAVYKHSTHYSETGLELLSHHYTYHSSIPKK